MDSLAAGPASAPRERSSWLAARIERGQEERIGLERPYSPRSAGCAHQLTKLVLANADLKSKWHTSERELRLRTEHCERLEEQLSNIHMALDENANAMIAKLTQELRGLGAFDSPPKTPPHTPPKPVPTTLPAPPPLMPLVEGKLPHTTHRSPVSVAEMVSIFDGSPSPSPSPPPTGFAFQRARGRGLFGDADLDHERELERAAAERAAVKKAARDTRGVQREQERHAYARMRHEVGQRDAGADDSVSSLQQVWETRDATASPPPFGNFRAFSESVPPLPSPSRPPSLRAPRPARVLVTGFNDWKGRCPPRIQYSDPPACTCGSLPPCTSKPTTSVR